MADRVTCPGHIINRNLLSLCYFCNNYPVFIVSGGSVQQMKVSFSSIARLALNKYWESFKSSNALNRCQHWKPVSLLGKIIICIWWATGGGWMRQVQCIIRKGKVFRIIAIPYKEQRCRLNLRSSRAEKENCHSRLCHSIHPPAGSWREIPVGGKRLVSLYHRQANGFYREINFANTSTASGWILNPLQLSYWLWQLLAFIRP